jgi:hypothetical protein
MSVGRQLCGRAIDVAADLRRYADLLDDFEGATEAAIIAVDARSLARKLEALVTPVLAFEGESRPALVAGRYDELLVDPRDRDELDRGLGEVAGDDLDAGERLDEAIEEQYGRHPAE